MQRQCAKMSLEPAYAVHRITPNPAFPDDLPEAHDATFIMDDYDAIAKIDFKDQENGIVWQLQRMISTDFRCYPTHNLTSEDMQVLSQRLLQYSLDHFNISFRNWQIAATLFGGFSVVQDQ